MLRRPVVEKVICEAGIILTVVLAVVIVVFPEVLDPDNGPEAPLLENGVLWDSFTHHVEVYPGGGLAPAHVDKDYGVGIIILEAADVEVCNMVRLVECMYLMLIIKGQGAI